MTTSMYLPGELIERDGYFMHPLALVDPKASIGNGTKVYAYAQVLNGAIIGKNCTIGTGCAVFSGARLGNGVKIQCDTKVWNGVTLENDVFVGPNAIFTNDLTPRAFAAKHGNFVPTLVKRGASLGAGSIILCGTTIGQYAAVGAGALVTKNVPDYTLVAGFPARVHRFICQCNAWSTLNFSKNEAVCSSCGRKYRIENETITQVA